MPLRFGNSHTRMTHIFLVTLFSELTLLGYVTNGLKHGKGIFKFPSGDIYVGDFHKGWLKGQATIFYVNGDIYGGSVLDNRKNGKGTYKYKNCNVYKGDWAQD
jgi:hypothetical protein